jgi:hypothetical protein
VSLLLRDSTDPFAVPLEGLAAVAGYGDGEFAWTSAGWARFAPPIVPLCIVVSADHVGDILDVENGDATPADVPRWVRAFRRPGRRRPTIYSARGTWSAIVAALESAGLSAADVDWWAATLDGTADVPGAVAVQARGAKLTGGDYDESVIQDPSWVGGTSVSLSQDQVNQEFNELSYLKDVVEAGADPGEPPGGGWLVRTLNGMPAAVAMAVVAALPTSATGGLTQQQVQEAVSAAVQPLADQLTRVEKALQGA